MCTIPPFSEPIIHLVNDRTTWKEFGCIRNSYEPKVESLALVVYGNTFSDNQTAISYAKAILQWSPDAELFLESHSEGRMDRGQGGGRSLSYEGPVQVFALLLCGYQMSGTTQPRIRR